MSTPETFDAISTTDQKPQDRAALLTAVQNFTGNPLLVVENIIQYNASHIGTPIILGGVGSEAQFARNYGTALNDLLKTPENKEKCEQLAAGFRGILDGSAAAIFSAWYGIR